jgi:hypothetical protein
MASKRKERGARIFWLVAAGESNASDAPGHEAQKCFRPAERHAFDEHGGPVGERIEPVAADVRAGRDRKAVARLRLIAEMLGLAFRDLNQREAYHRRHRMLGATVASVFGMGIAASLSLTACAASHQAGQNWPAASDHASSVAIRGGGPIPAKKPSVAAIRVEVTQFVPDGQTPGCSQGNMVVTNDGAGAIKLNGTEIEAKANTKVLLTFSIVAAGTNPATYKTLGISFKDTACPATGPCGPSYSLDPDGLTAFPKKQIVLKGNQLTVLDGNPEARVFDFNLMIQRSDGLKSVIDPKIRNRGITKGPPKHGNKAS